MRYRLGLDIGANSIGWAALRLDSEGRPCGVLDAGARVFPDGRDAKTGVSLAADRRAARGARRRRDRYLRRRAALLAALRRHGLMPGDRAEAAAVARLDPYALREAALRRRLAPHELGRVVFHLHQRRGFRSNRLADRGNEEAGVVRSGGERLAAEIARGGHATLGAWLAERHARRETVRARPRPAAKGGGGVEYDFYPQRAMVEAEFDKVWGVQSEWNPDLTEAARDDLRRILLYQRPLAPVRVGKCWLEPNEPRAPRALPTAQAYRIAQDLAHLRVRRPGLPDESLPGEVRRAFAATALGGKAVTAAQMRKALRLPQDATLSLDEVRGCETTARLAAGRKGKPGPLAAWWPTADLAARDAAASAILDSASPEEAVAALVALGVPEDAARAAEGATLPDGHASLSAKAMARLLPHLSAGLRYSDAVRAAGYDHHSDERPGEVLARLPYYGEVLAQRLGTGSADPRDAGEPERFFGRAPNPTVHVALNELRRVVNAVVARHGAPAEIAVEVLRDLALSAEGRREVSKRQGDHRRENERRAEELRRLGVAANGRNLARFRLWEAQARDPKERRCPYTGEFIGPALLFSDEVEEDHLLPYDLTFDDSDANRALCLRRANREKGRRTPHEAFGHTPEWEAIRARAALLPENKRWRFAPDAMERWRGEHAGFLDRHLHDSATAARWARLYLRVLCDPDKVWAVSGRLTATLRRALGLNADAVLGRGGARKDRTDHRHHAVDALVVALCDRGLVKAASDAARRGGDVGRRFEGFPEPWPGFVAEAARVVRGIVVSHRPDHGTGGALHNETAYGPVRGAGSGEANVRHRVPVAGLADPKHTPDVIRGAVADAGLAGRIVEAKAAGGKASLADLLAPNGSRVRRVRWRETKKAGSTADIRRRPGDAHPYKRLALDGNHCAEWWRGPDGAARMQVVSRFEAASRDGTPGVPRRPHPAARLLMRLHIDDVVAFGVGDGRRLLRVVKVTRDYDKEENSTLFLADLAEAGALKKRSEDKSDPFSYVTARTSRLRQERARPVHVDPSGRVYDPGPLAW